MGYADSSALISIACILSALDIVSVALRFCVRKQQKQDFGPDDWLVLPALLFAIGVAVCMLYGVHAHNLGYPSHGLSVSNDNDELQLSEKFQMAVSIMQAISLSFAKFSIIFFYRRIFNTGSKRAFDIFTKILLVFVFGWSTSWVGAYIFACGRNVHYQWGSYMDQDEHCARAVVKESFFVAADLAVDIILFIIPIPMIAHLKMPISRRFGIMIMFCIGTLTVLLSPIRVILLSLMYNSQESPSDDIDFSSEISTWMFWTMLEIGVAVIAVCLPTFAAWFHSISTETVFRHIRRFISIVFTSTISARRSSKSTNDPLNGGSMHNLGSDKSTFQAYTNRYMPDPE